MHDVIKAWLRMNVLRWSVISGLMKYRVSHAVSIIPIAGYAILWSEKFEGLLQYQQTLDAEAWFTASTRLHLIYFGSIILSIALVIFLIRCPGFIRRHSAIENYVLEQTQTATQNIKNGMYKKRVRCVGLKNRKFEYTELAGYILRAQLDIEVEEAGSAQGSDDQISFQINYLQHDDKHL
ncbi:MAG: hypothetical protein GY947_02990, partial [Rhodobacteraceae bacterium]|nr:hypothetical protein [Paracoccaceae bacterium]